MLTPRWPHADPTLTLCCPMFRTYAEPMLNTCCPYAAPVLTLCWPYAGPMPMLRNQVPYISYGRSMDEVFEGNANLTAKIMATFPHTRLLPVIGNHDTFPCDQQKAGDPEGSAARFLPLWAHTLSNLSQPTTH